MKWGLFLRGAAFVAGAVVLLVAAIWPWRAPPVDWQALSEVALAKRDCAALETILFHAQVAWDPDAHRVRARMAEQGLCVAKSQQEAEKHRQTAALVSRDQAPNSPVARWFNVETYAGDVGKPTLDGIDSMVGHLVDFLCVAPYTKWRQIDHTKLADGLLSDGIKIDTGLWQSFHSSRRALCLSVISDFLTHLLAQRTKSADRVAYELLGMPAGMDAPGAAAMSADLVLERNVRPVPDWLDNVAREKHQERLRDGAWSALESDARREEPAAMQKLMLFLHQGRFHPRNDERAYFLWLRLKRIGFDPDAIVDQRQFELTPEQRTEISRTEAAGFGFN
jgi:hypothetical protein